MKIKESEMIDKYMDPARELKNPLEREGVGGTNCIRLTWNSSQRLGGKKSERIGDKRLLHC